MRGWQKDHQCQLVQDVLNQQDKIPETANTLSVTVLADRHESADDSTHSLVSFLPTLAKLICTHTHTQPHSHPHTQWTAVTLNRKHCPPLYSQSSSVRSCLSRSVIFHVPDSNPLFSAQAGFPPNPLNHNPERISSISHAFTAVLKLQT